MTNPLVVNISGLGNTYAAPMEFQTIYGGVPKDLVAWCVDIYHHITLANYNPDLLYTDTNQLLTNSDPVNPQPLSSIQITRIGTLANFGALSFADLSLTGAARQVRLGAVQSAIWEVVSGRNVTIAGDTAFNNQVDAYAGLNFSGLYGGSIGSGFTFITPTGYPAASGTQAFVFAAVPEPGAWALMIGGFGLAGGMLRRRRAGPALAA